MFNRQEVNKKIIHKQHTNQPSAQEKELQLWGIYLAMNIADLLVI
jgi:hypothetical protein